MLHTLIARWRQRRQPAISAPIPAQIEAYQERERELTQELIRLRGVQGQYKDAAWLLALVVEELSRRPVEQQGTMYLAASSFVREHCLECGAEKGDQVYVIGSRFCGVCAEARLGRHMRAEPDNIDHCVPFGFEDAHRIW